MDPEVVPSSLAAIAPILRVANEIENQCPRVAFLCRFYAFERAHELDQTSSGRGVRQFKTAILQKVEQDADPVVNKSDAREMQEFYKKYYGNAQLAKTYQTAAVLFEVLRAVNQTESAEVAPEIMEAGMDVEAKKEIYMPYNIDPASASQAIMQLLEEDIANMEPSGGPEGPSRRLSRTVTTGTFSDVMDPEVVPSSLATIAPILRVANEIENQCPRVAYLCRLYAFERAHKLDPTSSGRGVQQFKKAMLKKLEQDADPTLAQRVNKSDAREMQEFYKKYYGKYIKALEGSSDQIDRAQLAKTYQTAAVLFEVLRAVNQTESTEVVPEIMEAGMDVEAKKRNIHAIQHTAP